MEKLGKYIQEYTVKNKCAEDIPVYSVTNTQGFCKDYFGKEVASKDKTTYKIVPKGYFAYNPSRINVGSVDWQRNKERVIVSPLYNVFSVSEQLHQQYLYYYLKSDIVRQFIKVIARGTVRDNLKLSMLCEFPIYVPSVLEQENIVVKLDGLQKVIKLRKHQLQKLDELIQARFVEMFEKKNCESVRLGDVCTKITDGTHKTPDYLDKGITFISAKNIVNGELDFSDVKHISEEQYMEIQKRCQTELNDILLSKSGSLGVPVIIKTDKRLGLFESLAVIKYDRTKLIPEFLCEQLKTERIQRQFRTGIKGVAVKHLHLGVISDIRVIVPPIEEQNQFAGFVNQVNKSKLVIKNLLQIYKHQIQM